MNTMMVLFGLNLAPLFSAIAMVESENGATSENIFQIRSIYYEDCWRICELHDWMPPPHYKTVVRSRELSESLMLLYWRHYGEHFRMQHPLRHIDYEWLARVHNGGPEGWHKDSTLGYWKRVSKHLDAMGVGK